MTSFITVNTETGKVCINANNIVTVVPIDPNMKSNSDRKSSIKLNNGDIITSTEDIKDIINYIAWLKDCCIVNL